MNLQMKLAEVVKAEFSVDIQPDISRPDEQFGDYSTNVAMQLAGKLKRALRDVAEQLVEALKKKLGDEVAELTIAGPGFINIKLNDAKIIQLADAALAAKPTTYEGQKIVVEYSDPNPFKVLHAGHLYTSIVGHAIGNLFEVAGGEVHRVNFGGDVGLHVGKTMWAMLEDLQGENPEKLHEIAPEARAEWMAKCYVNGSNAYEDDDDAKTKIVELNKRVYQIQKDQDEDSPLAQIYWTTRQWSYDYFDNFYERIGTPFEKYYPESTCAEIGIKTVLAQLENGIYQKSDGAVVFKGEPYGLHTRVFINSQGLPTYETKDVGLIMRKWEDYHFDRSLVITGNEQEQYMAVVLKSLEQFKPDLVKATMHITHGMLKLKGGVKMSSRKGNILRAEDILDAATEANKKLTGNDDQQVVLGAVKYALLKNRMGPDIIYDSEESVSLEGNSGPYLQYAHARARSILRKSKQSPQTATQLEQGERSFLRKISEYPEIVQKAVNEAMPHHICTYLYELAQAFNRFYEHNRVIDDSREKVRIKVVQLYADVLQDGLNIMGINAPEEM